MILIFASYQFRTLATTMRINRGMTQRDAAKASGLSQAHIHKIEAGKSSASLDSIEKLFAAYKFKVEFKVTDLKEIEAEQRRNEKRQKKAAEAAEILPQLNTQKTDNNTTNTAA
jgi:transcriptional regulator with XRE-family HTH domain